MMRLLKRLGLASLILIVGLLAPVGYIELACRPKGQIESYTAILPSEHHRDEGRTLLTYPEWHIVHAYDDYARVIRDGDPHDYRYLSPIAGFWTSLCSLSKASGEHGGFPASFKSTIYVIGVSFTAELLAKMSYEETIGRATILFRGATRAPLDHLSAQQATEYSQFLRQVPWYKWDFSTDAAALATQATSTFRDRERRLSLGIEYRTKALYAKVISAAVARQEPDALRLRMIVSGLTDEELSSKAGITVIKARDEGIEIEIPRYRALTEILLQLSKEGANFIEIAGNDDILFSVTSQDPELDGALYSFVRQGYGDTRHLVVSPVTRLAETLRGIDGETRLEHIHDY